MMEMGDDSKQLFRGLTADDTELETTQIESLCMDCGENGITKILLTKIPYYKEVVLMSFECEHCGFRNNELQSGSRIEDKGLHIKVNVKEPRDLNRQIVKSDYTAIKIPEMEFEIPSQSQKGEITTIEGILDRSIQGLEQDQPLRRIQDPDGAQKIDQFVAKMKKLKFVEEPFTLILDDVSGNVFVENLCAPRQDPCLEIRQFARTKEQDAVLGIYEEQKTSESTTSSGIPLSEPFTLENLNTEVLQFNTNCSNCNSPCDTNMKVTTCGCRTNEVRSGGGIEPKGCHLEVTISGSDDLKRDVLKSDTCSLQIPELQLEVGSNALGGRFSTVEGLLVAMKDQLLGHHANWGDSMTSESKQRYEKFLDDMDKALKAEVKCTLVLDDPAGNSYVQSLSDDGPDTGLKIERYERSFEQNEDLGLNDIRTEEYNKNETEKNKSS
ncbi:hypothetical protein B566_EDAN003645 [Ephemera danica]|nr:hypothetical protein B566_EDAN003645 [Ephemera danica]